MFQSNIVMTESKICTEILPRHTNIHNGQLDANRQMAVMDVRGHNRNSWSYVSSHKFSWLLWSIALQ